MCPCCGQRPAMPNASLCSTCYDWPAENPDEVQPEIDLDIEIAVMPERTPMTPMTQIDPNTPAFARAAFSDAAFDFTDGGAHGITTLQYLIAHAPAMPEGWVIGEDPTEPRGMYDRCKSHDFAHGTKTLGVYEYDYEIGLSPEAEKEFDPQDVQAYRKVCEQYTSCAVAFDILQQEFLRNNTPEKRAAAWAISWAREVVQQLNDK